MVYRIRICSKFFDVPKWIGDLYIVMGKFFFIQYLDWKQSSVSILGAFYFAHAVNSLLTNIGKLFIGAFRPHFIPSCFKKYNYHQFCNDTTQWIVNYTCIGETSANEKIQYGAYNIR